jgi:hypothetical protein
MSKKKGTWSDPMGRIRQKAILLRNSQIINEEDFRGSSNKIYSNLCNSILANSLRLHHVVFGSIPIPTRPQFSVYMQFC